MCLKTIGLLAAAFGVAVFESETASQLKVNFGGDSQESPVTASEAGTASDIVKVKARGVGANKDEALKDAFRDAVERAIGLYVDAEQMVENDKVVQDQVLTHSNAYITHYEEIDTKPLSGGLVQVKIVADVKKGQLTKKLEGVMPPQTVKVNGGILSDAYAQIVSKEKRAGDSAALLKAALKDCDPIKSLIVAGVRADSQKLLTGDQVQINCQPLPTDKVMLRYLFELKLDREKYFKDFVPHLKATLDQISLTKPKEVRLSERMQDEEQRKRVRGYLSGEFERSVAVMGRSVGRIRENPGFPESITSGVMQRPENACFLPVHEYTWGGGGVVCALPVSRRFADHGQGMVCWSLTASDRDSNMKPSSFQVALVSQMNDACSLGKMNIYDLELPLKSIVDETLRGLRRTGNGWETAVRTFVYNIVFADKHGEELAVEQWKVPAAYLLNTCCAFQSEYNGGCRWDGGAMWFITPFVGCFGENYLEWKSFVLDRELLKKIDTIKIELAE